MSDSKKAIGLMVRLPPELHREVEQYAQGTAMRPPISLNSAIVFLVRAGLAALRRAEQAENESGNWEPAGLELVEA
jgi:pectin methylesterase-like acyl-CoA thioesterase